MVSTLRIRTPSQSGMVDVTPLVQQVVTASGTAAGLCHVFVPHTTAGVTLNENADPDVVRDVLTDLDRLAPARDDHRHAEGNSHAHLKAGLTGGSVSVPIVGGRLALGVWQGVFLCEFDGPRKRSLLVTVLGESPVTS